MLMILNTDGGSRGNPGNAAIGIVIRDETRQIIFSEGKYIGIATNNVAEYKALIFGLEKSLELNISDLNVYMDSELIVKQIKGEYRVKDETLKTLYAQALQLIKQFKTITFTHTKREGNSEADKLVNQALDKVS